VTANRWLLRLYQLGDLLLEREENLDPADTAVLREHLERLVKAKTGTLRVDLSQYRMQVHRLRGGSWVARVTVDASGRTKVQR
jgi:hypothetical protein